MALSSTTIFEVETTGSDTLNGGAFDPGQTAGMFADGAATSANTAAPVFTSASYNFVAGDVGAWVYLSSGTTGATVAGGWYKIASVAANAATLNGTIGQGVLKTVLTPTTVVGCANGASPTAITWTIDYSQQAVAQFTYTDLASAGAGLTVSSAGFPFAKQQVGNSIVITGGTNFTAGRYVIASVAAGVATVVGPGNITTGVGASGTGGQGGTLLTIQAALTLMVVVDQLALVKTGTYNISAAITFPAGTPTAYRSCLIGYNAVRGDSPTGSSRPTIATNGNAVNAFTFTQTGWELFNFILDGAGASKGLVGFSSTGSFVSLTNVKILNFVTNGVNHTAGTDALLAFCEITACGAGAVLNRSGSLAVDCWIHDNTGTGLTITDRCSVLRSLVTNNTGASSDGIACGLFNYALRGNTIYGNGRDGIRTGSGAYSNHLTSQIADNIIANNGAFGINAQGATAAIAFQRRWDFNAFRSNTSGNYNNASGGSHDVLLTGDPFTNAAGNDFSLNNAAGAGAACRQAGLLGASPGALSTGYEDIGAVRHADPSVGVQSRPSLSGNV